MGGDGNIIKSPTDSDTQKTKQLNINSIIIDKFINEH